MRPAAGHVRVVGVHGATESAAHGFMKVCTDAAAVLRDKQHAVQDPRTQRCTLLISRLGAHILSRCRVL